MKRLLFTITVIVLFTFCNKENIAQITPENGKDNPITPATSYTMKIIINGNVKTATIINNSSGAALKTILDKGDITYEAHDYGNFEKVGNIGHDLPQNNESITTVPGDIILYQGNNVCLYYATNTWNFTRLGKIDNITQTELKEFLNVGGGNIMVTLSVR